MGRPFQSPAAHLAAVAALSAASGAPYGLVNELLPLWFMAQGTDLAALGVLSLVALPWTLKPLWAPVIDRVGSLRDWRILTATLLAALTTVIAARPAGGHVVPVLVLVAVVSATQDVAIDGWVVTRTPEQARGRAAGVRVAAYRVSMALVGGAAAAVGAWYDWQLALVAVVALLYAFAALQWSLPDVAPTSQGASRDNDASNWNVAVREWLARRETWAALAFVALFKLGDGAIAPMTRPWLAAEGLDVGTIGLVTATTGMIGVTLGALVGGQLVATLGLRRAAWAAGLFQIASNLVFALVTGFGPRVAVGASLLESFSGGVGTAALIAVCMGSAAGPAAATRFAILTGVLGLARSAAGAVSGHGVVALGYPGWFFASTLLSLPAFAVLHALAPPAPRAAPRAAAS